MSALYRRNNPFFKNFFYNFLEKIVLSARNENILELLLKYTNKYTFFSLKNHMYYIYNKMKAK
jgi:hypothetical protein